MIWYIIGMTLGGISIATSAIYFLILSFKNRKFKANIKRIGSTAEKQINDDIKTWAKHTKNFFINNSLYKYNENKVFEVDSILITDKALIVIEIKSIKGKISGEASGRTWIKSLGETKHAISNPITQNDKHIDHIIKATKIEVPTISLIIFSNRASSVEISNIPGHVVITRHANLFDQLDEINRSLPVKINDYEMKTIGASIKSYRTNKREDINLHKKITTGGKSWK